MEFNSEKSIYLQICDRFYERIISGELTEESRIPSVREYGAEIGVNPNTVMRSYEKMTGDGIIYNRRGIGYFISQGAKEKIFIRQRTDFIEQELPVIVKRMKLLKITGNDFLAAYNGTGFEKSGEQSV